MIKKKILRETAEKLVASGKGILASDSSTGSIKKRFDKVGVESTEGTRRVFRGLFFTTAGIEEFISGVIMFDETIRQKTDGGVLFPRYLLNKGILPGIKVDKRAWPMANFPGEKVTDGLDGLRDRLKEYKGLGARFAKWRAVIAIGKSIPTRACVEENAHLLARYAALCQEAGVVPVVEPEVLMDGNHSARRCLDVTVETLKAVFSQLIDHKVYLEGMLLKTNMILPGKGSSNNLTDEEVAKMTIQAMKKAVPLRVPGIVFLSGGQSAEEATRRLNAINQLGKHPWKTSFSFERALQEPSLRIWSGKDENIARAKEVFYKRAKMNSLATLGEYTTQMEGLI